MITIKNISKRTLVFHLHHGHACSEEDGCACGRLKVGIVDRDAVTGKQTVRALHKRIPDTITLFPKGMADDTVTDLPNGMTNSEEVKAALRAGQITIEDDRVKAPEDKSAAKKPDAPPGKPAPPAPPPAPETTHVLPEPEDDTDDATTPPKE